MEPTRIQTIFPPDFELSAPSEEQVANDPKLAYLWEKYGKNPQ